MDLKSTVPKPVNGHLTLFFFRRELLFHLSILTSTSPGMCWIPWALCSYGECVRDKNDWHIRGFCPSMNIWTAAGRSLFHLISSKAGSKKISWIPRLQSHRMDYLVATVGHLVQPQYIYFLLFYSCQKCHRIPTNGQGIGGQWIVHPATIHAGISLDKGKTQVFYLLLLCVLKNWL